MACRWYNAVLILCCSAANNYAVIMSEEHYDVLDLAGHRPLRKTTLDLTDPRVLFVASDLASSVGKDWATLGR